MVGILQKTIGLLAIALLLVGFVNAGSVENLNYKDRTCVFGFCDTDREIDDNNVIVDADTLDGDSKEDLINSAKSYSDENDDVGGGISEKHALGLIDVFFDKIKSLFAPRDDFRLLETWAKQNGYDPKNPQIISDCVATYGNCGYCSAGNC